MAAHHGHNEKTITDAREAPVIEIEKPAGAHEEYVVDSEGKPVRIDYSGAHKKTDPEEIKYDTRTNILHVLALRIQADKNSNQARQEARPMDHAHFMDHVLAQLLG